MADTTSVTGKETVNINTETFVCENCGGLVKFSIAKQKFTCESCGSEFDLPALSDKIVEHDFSGYIEREKRTVPFEGMAVVSCQRCGMEVTFAEQQIAATCPMCASTQVATVKQSSGLPPDGLVPFKIDKNDAQQKFKAWVRSRWFAPGDFKKKYGEGDLKGMYLPFWTYDANVASRYTGRGGRRRSERSSDGKTRTVIDWFPVSGTVSSSFDDVQVSASSKQGHIKGILPYGTVHNTKTFSAAYLSGYYAEVYKIKADSAFNDAKRIMENAMRSLALMDIKRRYDVAELRTLNSSYSNVTYKHVLLPLWESAFGYNGKAYNYLVNGETGKVSGSRPYSPLKIAAAVIACLLAIIIALLVLSSTETKSSMSSGRVTLSMSADDEYNPTGRSCV